ncbi:MAG: cytosine permease [Phycisphaerae bacterium]|nr:cytosine permease [Phycisphaerae bacterium]
MATENLPNYLTAAKPNPMENRAPWYKNIAPSYAGIFISVPFMAGMAGALQFGSVWAGFIGLLIGALFCFMLYYVPGLLGFKTGMPLYVVGASTFGTQGGILMPGLLMGFLQIGWHAVFTVSAASFFMDAIGSEAGPNTGFFWLVCAVWGLAFAFVGAVGISWLGWMSSWIPIFPLVAIVIAGFANMGGIGKFETAGEIARSASIIPVLGLGAFAALQAAAGFFASAGAAGADFTMNSRSPKDVVLGGFFGITVAALVAGTFALFTIAGGMGNNPALAVSSGMVTGNLDIIAAFSGSIGEVGGLSKIMFWVFVIACICPTGFCAFLAANSFSTMFPKLPRVGMTMAAGIVGVILAATGVANNLAGFFGLIGASFGPIIGAMTADYIRSGGWSGPRKGINLAGYIAWGVGFLVGILGALPGIGFAYGLETLMSFIVGFSVYLIAAEMGLEPPKVELEKK